MSAGAGDTLVTILMWCRGIEIGYFRAALRSVLSQTSPRWRLCVVVDRDDPDTAAAIRPELDRCRDPRISMVRTEAKLITGALNAGMRRAVTPYVCVLHADDLLDERAIEILSDRIAERPDVDYFHSSRSYIDDAGLALAGPRRSAASFTLDDFKDRSPVKHLHCFNVASALAIGGMDESLGLHAADDYDFPWCMAEAGYTFQAIPECLYHYRDHRSHYRLTTHVPLETQVGELVKILRKHGLTEVEIEHQIRRRTAGYMRQALYRDEDDRRAKERAGYDIRRGWRERYGEAHGALG